MPMSYEPVDVIRREAARFAHVLRDVPDAAVVPSCPGWTAADLLWHLTEVHLFWGAVVGSGPRPTSRWRPSSTPSRCGPPTGRPRWPCVPAPRRGCCRRCARRSRTRRRGVGSKLTRPSGSHCGCKRTRRRSTGSTPS
ncbi:maleylpyruvate isomerase N-terminal domain-containing protein [Tessaracoccus defluvii]|uniref:Maleylpyruvate isomerase N-terminal domain-containing protein n=1 Tax=Tessaracoccus defluvii TaxID=1285901 RepID=A0A7H0H899_9ACTN|nr:maleylpyruvate isomerase N-terminal domain-containing protein [Tessaracoccus defluvii]